MTTKWYMIALLSLFWTITSFVFAQPAWDDIVCTMQYDPVCALVQIQCITTPCDPIPETFGNACEMSRRWDMATYLYHGECEDSKVVVAQAIREQISELSPVDPVLWGTRFPVTVTFEDNNRVHVVYEDGHMQEEIDLAYSIETDTVVLERIESETSQKELLYTSVIETYITNYLTRYENDTQRREALEHVNQKITTRFETARMTQQAYYFLTLIQGVVEKMIEQFH